MKSPTQLAIVASVLKRRRRISRNYCLSLRITRLASRIVDLKRKDWTFKTERDEGDYVYKLISRPN